MLAQDQDWVSTLADDFQAGVPSAHVVRLPNADHRLWETHEADVLREMNNFMDGLTH